MRPRSRSTLIVVAGLWLLGGRLRGPWLGAVLAYAWAACPFTLYVLSSNSNDALVAALLVGALLALASPVRLGVLAALVALTKFAPLALAPMLALHAAARGGTRRALFAFAAAFAAAALVAGVPALAHSDPTTIVDSTLRFQLGRDSPFSIWGQADLDRLKPFVMAAAVGVALYAAWAARSARAPQVAALGAAVLMALQLTAEHWFYLYLVWFLPFVFVALFARYREPAAA